MNDRDELFRGEQPSLWKFWRDGVTASFLQRFIQCKEQTRLTFVEGWSSRNVPLAFEYGTCCHWILSNIYRQKPYIAKHSGTYRVLEWWVEQQIRTYHTNWLETVQMPTNKQLEQQEHVYGLALLVLPHYIRRWDGDFTGSYSLGGGGVTPVDWLNLEEHFTVPYTFPDGKATCIQGKRDALFKDASGKLWVMDTKCRSIVKEDELADAMPFDTQFMTYCWVTSQKEGTPAGIVQNIIRRPGQRINMYGGLPLLLQKVREEVQPKKYDHYFTRLECIFDKHDVRHWQERFLDPVMEEIRMWWEGRIPHYANYDALMSKYGPSSLFAAITRGDFSGCYKRDVPFSELARTN